MIRERQILTFVVVVVLAFAAGYGIGLKKRDMRGVVMDSTDIRSVAENTALQPESISFYAVIEEVNGNILRVKLEPALSLPKGLPEKLKILVTDSTSVFMRTKRDPDEFQREMAGYVAAKSGKGTMPSPFIDEKYESSLLRAGDRILVESLGTISDEELRAAKIVVDMDSPPRR